MNKIIALVAILLSPQVKAQDFDFQLDRVGNAFYEDSVEVLNQDLDSAFIKISNWATGQVLSEKDTLEFSQSSRFAVHLKKVAQLKFADELRYFLFTLDISMDNRLLKYKVYSIYHYNDQLNEKCNNLGEDFGVCGFQNNPRAWNLFRRSIDQYITRLLYDIEEYLESK